MAAGRSAACGSPGCGLLLALLAPAAPAAVLAPDEAAPAAAPGEAAPAEAWPPAPLALVLQAVWPHVPFHELGHNLALDHAGWTDYGTRSYDAYADRCARATP